jgi:hypothetical protein
LTRIFLPETSTEVPGLTWIVRLGAVDLNDHCVAGIFSIGRDAVVEAIEAGFVPALEDRLPMASAGADTPNRHLDADGIAGNSYRRSRAAESLPLLRHTSLRR